MIVLQPSWIWTSRGLQTDWCVSVEDGRIVGLNPPTRHCQVDQKLPGRLMMPGFVNAHSHAFQRAFRGFVQRTDGGGDFWSWRKQMTTVANRLSPEGIEAVSQLAFLEMLEAGFTHVGEFHYLHHQPDGSPYADPDELARRVISAAQGVGLKLTLLRVAYERNAPGDPLSSVQLRFGDKSPEDVLAALERLKACSGDGVTIGLAPHSVRTVSRSWLQALSGVDGVVHSHVSEQPMENEACQQEHGCSPLRLLHDAGLVDQRFCAVHFTHPLQGDRDLLKRQGARVCVCPSTELDLGDGFLPVAERKELTLCVGSDSQTLIDPFIEIRSLENHGRALAGQRHVLGAGLAEQLLKAGTLNGSAALGAGAQGIEVGAQADLTCVDLRRPASFEVPPLEAAVFSANADWVSEVWVAGKQVIVDGQHPGREAICARAEQALRGLLH
jgi:formimidoylglutamate deiminase